MGEHIRSIPSDNDFKQVRAKIIYFIRKKTEGQQAASVEEIAEYIQRSEAVTDEYCEQLRINGIIKYIPTGGGNWDFIMSPESSEKS
jgi:Mn-dependent DtxR family transcriptional regulator